MALAALRNTLLALSLATLAACGVPIEEPPPPPPPAPPAPPPTPAEVALAHANEARAALALPAFVNVDAIQAAAEAHARYSATVGPPDPGNVLSLHDEQPGMPGFTGVTFRQRMAAAGYGGEPFSEVMHQLAEPAAAVDGWLETIFHRVPFIHPNARDVGYGLAVDARRIDVMNFGRGPADPALVVVYPPPGATDVAPSFSGIEAPPPPPPPSGFWPSGPIISIAPSLGTGDLSFVGGKLELERVELYDDDTGELLPITLIDEETALFGQYMMNSVAFYGDGPAAGGATFRVVVEGAFGIDAFAREWTFTVRADP